MTFVSFLEKANLQQGIKFPLDNAHYPPEVSIRFNKRCAIKRCQTGFPCISQSSSEELQHSKQVSTSQQANWRSSRRLIIDERAVCAVRSPCFQTLHCFRSRIFSDSYPRPTRRISHAGDNAQRCCNEQTKYRL